MNKADTKQVRKFQSGTLINTLTLISLLVYNTIDIPNFIIY